MFPVLLRMGRRMWIGLTSVVTRSFGETGLKEALFEQQALRPTSKKYDSTEEFTVYGNYW